MTERECERVLGLVPGAAPREIRSAYVQRSRALKQGAGDSANAQELRQLDEAYRTLKARGLAPPSKPTPPPASQSPLPNPQSTPPPLPIARQVSTQQDTAKELNRSSPRQGWGIFIGLLCLILALYAIYQSQPGDPSPRVVTPENQSFSDLRPAPDRLPPSKPPPTVQVSAISSRSFLGHFQLGAKVEEVIQGLGVPDLTASNRLYYGSAYVLVEAERVVGWVSSVDCRLPGRIPGEVPSRETEYSLGSDMAAIVSIQGQPSSVTGDVWAYGDWQAVLVFSNQQLVGWSRNPDYPLKSILQPASAGPSHFTHGSTIYDVVRIHGQPETVSPHVYAFGDARVYTVGYGVVNWVDGSAIRLKAWRSGGSLPSQLNALAPETGFFTIGSTKAEVQAAQGNASKGFLGLSRNKWTYGESVVHFEQGRVIRWEEDPEHPLKTILITNEDESAAWETIRSLANWVVRASALSTPGIKDEDLGRYAALIAETQQLSETINHARELDAHPRTKNLLRAWHQAALESLDNLTNELSVTATILEGSVSAGTGRVSVVWFKPISLDDLASVLDAARRFAPHSEKRIEAFAQAQSSTAGTVANLLQQTDGDARRLGLAPLETVEAPNRPAIKLKEKSVGSP